MPKKPIPFPGCIGDVVINAATADDTGLTTDLSAGQVHLKLSRIGKRADVRAWPIRDTVISRWYHGRLVKRKVKADSFPLTGSYKTDTDHGTVYVHLDFDNPAGIPTATWLLTAADYTWEVYCPVDVA
jgi:hypothetical protein